MLHARLRNRPSSLGNRISSGLLVQYLRVSQSWRTQSWPDLFPVSNYRNWEATDWTHGPSVLEDARLVFYSNDNLPGHNSDV